MVFLTIRGRTTQRQVRQLSEKVRPISAISQLLSSVAAISSETPAIHAQDPRKRHSVAPAWFRRQKVISPCGAARRWVEKVVFPCCFTPQGRRHAGKSNGATVFILPLEARESPRRPDCKYYSNITDMGTPRTKSRTPHEEFLAMKGSNRPARLHNVWQLPKPVAASLMGGGVLRWEFGQGHYTPPATLCFDFARLAQASDEQIRRFAQKWGPLAQRPLHSLPQPHGTTSNFCFGVE